MKTTKVNDRTIKDLLKSIRCIYSADFVQDVLCAVKKELPLFADIDTVETESKAIAATMARYFRQHPQKDNEDWRYDVNCCLEMLTAELHNHLPRIRPEIVDAVIAENNDVVEIIKKLKKIVATVKAVREKLDPRSQALFQVLNSLWYVDATLGTEFLNELLEIDGNISILRSDRSLQSLLDAYDLATEFYDTQES